MARISSSQLLKLQKKYRTDASIGKLFGISRQAVHQLRNKYNIPPIQDKYAKRNREILDAYSKGAACTKIARTHKLTVSQVYRIIRTEKAQ
jgi:hypothetical protein